MTDALPDPCPSEAGVRDVSLSVGTRIAWARQLAAWDPPAAARAAADLEGDESDVARVRRALLGRGEE